MGIELISLFVVVVAISVALAVALWSMDAQRRAREQLDAALAMVSTSLDRLRAAVAASEHGSAEHLDGRGEVGR